MPVVTFSSSSVAALYCSLFSFRELAAATVCLKRLKREKGSYFLVPMFRRQMIEESDYRGVDSETSLKPFLNGSGGQFPFFIPSDPNTQSPPAVTPFLTTPTTC